MPDLSQPTPKPPLSQPATWNWTSKPRFALAGMMVVIVALTALVFRQTPSGPPKTTNKTATKAARPTASNAEAPAWMGPSPVATLPDDRHSPAPRGAESAPFGDVQLPQAPGRGAAPGMDDDLPGPSLRAPDSESMEGPPSFGPGVAPAGETNALLDQEMKVEQARANRLHSQEEFIAACRALEEFNRNNGRDLLAAEKAVSEQQAQLLQAEQAMEQMGRLTRKGYRPPAERQKAELEVKTARIELDAAMAMRDDIRSARGHGSLEQLLTAKEVAAAEMGIAQTEYVTELAKLDQLRSMPAAALAARMSPDSKSAGSPSFAPHATPGPVRAWGVDDGFRSTGAVEGGVARLRGGIEK
jgi:hypothetical protein